MRTLYLECSAGASGDMILASLTDLLPDDGMLRRMIDSLCIPGITVETEKTKKCGISGIKVTVRIDGQAEGPDAGHAHHHSQLSDMEKTIGDLDVSENVKNDAISIYNLIAEAESSVHGEPVRLVHFHEVGALDALTDIVGACMLMEILAPERVIASPVRTGYGSIRCSHGILPIPAPATERLLRGIPAYAGEFEGEFCTPTGAAILKHFVDEFTYLPLMRYDDVGYGIGDRDFPLANFMRAYMGDAPDASEQISELSCNIDDMTPEDLAYAADILRENGALDVFTTPIIMKKGRPAFMLTCLCREEGTERFARMMLEHTSTAGIRKSTRQRYTMKSSFETVETEYGGIRVKHSSGYGIEKDKPEFDDLSRLAAKNDAPIRRVRESLGKH